jgi:hypothetical protein
VRRVIGAHPHYAQFYDYGDATAFHTTLKKADNRLRGSN